MFGGKIKYPYFNMQQLNLDWMLEHISHMPEIVQLPALAGDTLTDVTDMIDYKELDIPKDICFLRCGLQDDNLTRRCAVLLFKEDIDNMAGIVMSSELGVQTIVKKAGGWQ